MRIEYLGHAGFIVSHEGVAIIMDPWLSETGAFDSAWFQFPCNHQYYRLVKQYVAQQRDNTFIYVSHEHKDHFDKGFLSSVVQYQPRLIIPAFQLPDFFDEMRELGFQNILVLEDCESHVIRGTGDGCLAIKLFVDDNQLNRDSAILVSDGKYKFLNLNDCKIFDRLNRLKLDEGHIDVFACQFSGATWHPTCYQYEKSRYDQISRRKRISKFVSVLNAIKLLEPGRYFPSAGPACFLDPMLMHINFEAVNIFPHQYEACAFLKKGIENTCIDPIMPGDVFDTEQDKFVALSDVRMDSKEQVEKHICYLAEKYRNLFDENKRSRSAASCETILERLREELLKKVSNFHTEESFDVSLYFTLEEMPKKHLRVCLQTRQVEPVDTVPADGVYHLTFPAWQIERVLDRDITWEDFSLTFRVKLDRTPDTYNTLINGFFFSEAENLAHLVKTIDEIRGNKARIVIDADGVQFEVNQYCPHQGANLQHGWAHGECWVCPRHRWEFDLENGGQCTTSNDSIHSIRCISLEAES